ncbi:ferredoxin-NADP reductase/predicted pyridoxine 5'-phosphate oxidase superfamily flavin-nucleotide-binding protein, partial [Oxalobacteraceae bacterium GrIS 1.11]
KTASDRSTPAYSSSTWPSWRCCSGDREHVLRVLDAHTIGFADLQGNRQYISLGNMSHDGRIALILMDWVAKRRLKVMGRVRVVERQEDTDLVARVAIPGYGVPERAYIITIEGFDWNCPQHITQRYPRASVDQAMMALRAQVAQLQDAAANNSRQRQAASGNGPLHLRLRAIRQVSPRVRVYELATANGGPLPPEAVAGAHLEVPVRLQDSQEVLRHYSLMPLIGHPDACEIAVQREDKGRGASVAIHAQWSLGLELRLSAPRNHFPLHQDARPTLLLAAGIGITPLRAMALQLHQHGRPFALHVGARDSADAALVAGVPFKPVLHLSTQGGRMDVAALIDAATDDTVVYACGPEHFIEQASAAAQQRGLVLHVERFAPAAARLDDRSITVTLARSKKTVLVAPGTSILEAVEQAGVQALASCRTGDCGTCTVACLAGEPEHRDQFLTEAEKQEDKRLCICVSRARGDALTLDL